MSCGFRLPHNFACALVVRDGDFSNLKWTLFFSKVDTFLRARVRPRARDTEAPRVAHAGTDARALKWTQKKCPL